MSENNNLNQKAQQDLENQFMWGTSKSTTIGSTSFQRIDPVRYEGYGQVTSTNNTVHINSDLNVLPEDPNLNPNPLQERSKYNFSFDNFEKIAKKMDKYSSKQIIGKGVSTNTGDNVLTLKDNQGREMLRFEQSGDIYIKDEFVTTDFQIVEGFRQFLKQHKLHP